MVSNLTSVINYSKHPHLVNKISIAYKSTVFVKSSPSDTIEKVILFY